MQKIIVLTVASHDNLYLQALKKSAEKHGMPIHVIKAAWQGFGTKVIEVRNYLKTLTEYTHFIFVDAYDTLFQRPITEVPDCILFSTEKQKWPDPDAPYPYEWSEDDPWPFLNAGVYSASIDKWIEMIDANPSTYEMDDQRYFTQLFLSGESIKLDTSCSLFQSMAFEQPGDFSIIDGKVHNNVHKTTPAILHFNGKCHSEKIYRMQELQTIAEAKAAWKQTVEGHQWMNEQFIARVNDDDELNAHRTFVENNVFGFGERSFHWMWKLIIDAMPKQFTFLEIGVLKGQTLSLVELLAKRSGKKAKRYGVTPLSTEGGVWESNYEEDIKLIHDKFGIKKDYTILKGLSEDPVIIERASKLNLDCLYIDGGHSEAHVINDLKHYAPLVKSGGYMIIDDCCSSFPQPFGYFCGINSVTKIVDQQLPPFTLNSEWNFVFSVVHNRVFQRV